MQLNGGVCLLTSGLRNPGVRAALVGIEMATFFNATVDSQSNPPVCPGEPDSLRCHASQDPATSQETVIFSRRVTMFAATNCW